MKHVLRACATVLASTALAVTAVGASPASADGPVPDGCVGSIAYVCTGDAKPPVPASVFAEVGGPVSTGMQLVPGQTVDGQQVGGVVVPVEGVTIPGYETSVGGPTEPVVTGVTMPVTVCAYVTCVVAGEPIVVPGLPLPLVPVVVPSTTVPGQYLTVPVLGTTPPVTTPGVSTPAYDVDLILVWVYVDTAAYLDAAEQVCEAGGGHVTTSDYFGRTRYRCASGQTSTLANEMYLYGGFYY